MKKLMLLAAMLALVVVAASPAFAQTIDVGEGDVTLTNESTVMDSIVSSCPASVTFGDENANGQVVVSGQNSTVVLTGNENEVEIEQALTQSGFNPEVATECTQEIAQAAAAGAGKAEAKAGGAEAKAGEAPKAEAKAGGAEAKAGGAEAKAGGAAPKAEAKAELPKTGGGASLLALGAGALLVGGGLVARRIIK
jgi:LPXTG-motif cell wall-anchored protein